MHYSAYLGSAVSIVRWGPTIWRASTTYSTQISRLSPAVGRHGQLTSYIQYRAGTHLNNLARRVIGARSVRDAGQPLGQIQVTLRLTTY